MNRKILLKDRHGEKTLVKRTGVGGQGLGKWGRLGGVHGARALRPSPEEVEGGLWGRQDVKGHRQRQTLSEVGQVELGASKLPLYISIILGTEMQEATLGPCWHGHSDHLGDISFCLPLS